MKSKLSLADGIGDKRMGRQSLQLQIKAIDSEERVRCGEADPFVPVEECVVVGQRFHERGGFVNQVIVIAGLRMEHRRFQQAAISEAVDSPKLFDEMPVHFEDFADRQVGRSGIYLARS